MRIVLMAINARYTHSSLALRYLRNALEIRSLQRGLDYEPMLREYHISQPRLDIVRDVAARRPALLLISSYIWTAELLSLLLPDLRALVPACRIVLGGPEAAYNPDPWLVGHPEIDLIVRGSAEAAAELFCDPSFSFDAYPGRYVELSPTPFASVPFPYRDDDFAELAGRYLYYETSRGCPFRCAYCLSSREDQALEEKDAVTACAELDALVAAKPGLVKLVDRSFNAGPERARLIWRHLIREHADSGCRFHFELHPLFLEDEDYRLLANAPEGFFQFELGVQTVHTATRAAIGRGGDWPREKAAIARLIALKTVHLHLDLIAGLPGEGLPELAQSFNELMELGADQLQLGFLKGLPGTALREGAASFGALFQAHAPYEVLRTDSLSSEDLSALKRVEALADSLYNSGRFRADMKRAAVLYGGYFTAYEAFAGHAEGRGFDLRTKDRMKLAPLLEEFLSR
ncbi:MAG TPA: hypothetical protein DCG47_13240 [Spirochaetaceae bacterium]|nr:hypothetical protein [Spirochaetaceae bacterium]